jgi:SAM-dependent methyltransferase
MDKDFLPNFIYIFSNPFFITRRYLYIYIKHMSKYFKSGILLDIGCGTKPYEKLFAVDKYIGIDFEKNGNNNNPKADILYDGKKFPIESESVNYVLATEVLEHVFNPTEFIEECNRVLKVGGLCLITVPFVWDEHEQPFDYGRYTSFGLKFLAEKNGFEVIEQTKTGNFITTLGQMICTYFYYIFHNKKYIYKISLFLFFAPIQILTLMLAKVFPVNKNFYLDNIMLIRKKINL